MYDYVDLFAGAGGWDVAAHNLGLHGVGIEMNRAACLTREAEHFPTVQASVTDCDPEDYRMRGLIASPPCQEWSSAGNQRSSGLRGTLVERIDSGVWVDENGLADLPLGAQLVCEPLWWATCAKEDNEPYRWIALEQVVSVLPAWEAIGRALRRMGYSVWTGILSAERYGVPQNRRRAILTASLEDEVNAPVVTQPQSLGWGTCVSPGDFDGLMPAGRSSPGQPYPRNAAAPTVTSAANAVWVHRKDYHNVPDGKLTSPQIRGFLPRGQEYRTINVAEMAALQTFPADYRWRGSAVERAQQVGNAIPPKFAEAILGTLTRKRNTSHA